MPETTPFPLPPRYILISQSNLPSSSAPSGTNETATSSTLIFPDIQYHYVDDPPLALLPNSKDAPPYIVMDWDPNTAAGDLVVRSLSDGVSVVGLKVVPAPGVRDDVEHDMDTNMYVVETVNSATPSSILDPRTKHPTSDTQDWVNNPSGALARFKQRNVMLREVFDFSVPQLKDAETLGDQRVATSPASSPGTMRNVPLAPQ